MSYGFVDADGATVSIKKGSTVGQLSKPVPFPVGLKVTIGVGYEPGAGAIGTLGVGGMFPRRAYPTEAAMRADTGRNQGAWARIEGDPQVWRYWGSAWQRLVRVLGNAGDSYWWQALPLALETTVVRVNGTEIEFADPAQEDAAGAPIFHNVKDIIHQIVPEGSHLNPIGTEIVLPPGRFAISTRGLLGRFDLNLFFFGRAGHIVGSGIDKTVLVTPPGAVPVGIGGQQCGQLQFGDLTVQSNRKDSGWAFAIAEDGTGDWAPWGGAPGIVWVGGQALLHKNVKTVDLWGEACSLSGLPGQNWLTDARAEDCLAIQTGNLLTYLASWKFKINDLGEGDKASTTRCNVDAAWIEAGYEIVNCRGADATHNAGIGRNAAMAINSGAGAIAYRGMNITWEKNRLYTEFDANAKFSPVIKAASVIWGQWGVDTKAVGGAITDCVFDIWPQVPAGTDGGPADVIVVDQEAQGFEVARNNITIHLDQPRGLRGIKAWNATSNVHDNVVTTNWNPADEAWGYWPVGVFDGTAWQRGTNNTAINKALP
jgi:hypothetical protein